MSAEQALLHKLSAVFADERGRAAGQLVLAGVEAQVVCDLVFGETGHWRVRGLAQIVAALAGEAR